MTSEFNTWFEKFFPSHLWPVASERDEVKTYTWIAWRDSRKEHEATTNELAEGYGSQFTDERLREIEKHQDSSLLGPLPGALARELRTTRKKLGNYYPLMRRATAAEALVYKLLDLSELPASKAHSPGDSTWHHAGVLGFNDCLDQVKKRLLIIREEMI